MNSIQAFAALDTLLLDRIAPAAVDLTPNKPEFCETAVFDTVELMSGAESAETSRPPAAVTEESLT